MGEVYRNFPLLLPQDKDGLSYDGFITINEQSFRFSITQPTGKSLTYSSINCSWRLWNILRGYEDVIKQRLHQSEDLASFLVEFKTLVEKLVKCKVQDEIQSLSLKIYSSLTNELELIGWDKLAYVNESFNVIKLKRRDSKEREHIVTVHIPEEYPDVLPKCSVDVPDHVFHFKALNISEGRLLERLYHEFCELVNSFEMFWDVVDEIDENCWVLEPEHPTKADASRRVALGNNTSLHIKIDPRHPRMLPECRLMGADSVVINLRENMNKNLQKWVPEKPIVENLEALLEKQFPSRQTTKKEDFSVECGICYAYRLDNAIPESACDDARCGQPFHNSCLYEWLRALPSSRQSFNIIFGECPYCNKPITVKVK